MVRQHNNESGEKKKKPGISVDNMVLLAIIWILHQHLDPFRPKLITHNNSSRKKEREIKSRGDEAAHSTSAILNRNYKIEFRMVWTHVARDQMDSMRAIGYHRTLKSDSSLINNNNKKNGYSVSHLLFTASVWFFGLPVHPIAVCCSRIHCASFNSK